MTLTTSGKMAKGEGYDRQKRNRLDDLGNLVLATTTERTKNFKPTTRGCLECGFLGYAGLEDVQIKYSEELTYTQTKKDGNARLTVWVEVRDREKTPVSVGGGRGAERSVSYQKVVPLNSSIQARCPG